MSFKATERIPESKPRVSRAHSHEQISILTHHGDLLEIVIDYLTTMLLSDFSKKEIPLRALNNVVYESSHKLERVSVLFLNDYSPESADHLLNNSI